MDKTVNGLFLEIDQIYSEWHGGDLNIGKEREFKIKELIKNELLWDRYFQKQYEHE
jgi:hypothetical protein